MPPLLSLIYILDQTFLKVTTLLTSTIELPCLTLYLFKMNHEECTLFISRFFRSTCLDLTVILVIIFFNFQNYYSNVYSVPMLYLYLLFLEKNFVLVILSYRLLQYGEVLWFLLSLSVYSIDFNSCYLICVCEFYSYLFIY